MLIEKNDFDLSLLMPYFTEDKDYPKEVCLAELLEWRKYPDFLVILHTGDNNEINGFMIAHRVRNTLWIHQCWHKPEPDLKIAKQSLEYAKDWAYGKGMTSMTFETNREEGRAWERLGFFPYTVNYKCEV
jgi:hypothetical protein